MAWIESHQELAEHPKTKRLARATGISVPTAIGHLHLLWWWAANYAEDGDLQRYSAEDIADAARWEGEVEQFTKALIHAGFLDKENDHMRIHDWCDYAGRLIEQRKKNRQRMRQARSTTENTQDANSASTCNTQKNTSLHRSGLPYHTRQYRPNQRPASGERRRQTQNHGLNMPILSV